MTSVVCFLSAIYVLQIDPFKVRTYGEKKPLDAKEERIQKLLEENKRYYPIQKDGKPKSNQ